MDWSLCDEGFNRAFRPIYGDYFAGFILGDALRLANLLPVPLYGLWQIEALQEQPEVQQAKELDPNTKYFLDAANIWFYGYENGHLLVFDSDTGELDDLGTVEMALDALLFQWESARNK
jgi:hypothetical protein